MARTRVKAHRSSASLHESTETDTARLKVLQRYRLLEQGSELALHGLAQLAAQICQTPIAWISFVGPDRQWIRAGVGLAPQTVEREFAWADQILAQQEMLLIPDALVDGRWSHYAWVAGEPGIRFYVGIPLMTSDGMAIGTLSVMAPTAHTLTVDQSQALQTLARQVMTQLELRRTSSSLKEVSTRYKQTEIVLLEHRRLASLAAEVGAGLGQPGSLPDMLDRCVQATVTHLGVAFARIWTLDPETNLLELQAIAGQHSHTEDFPSRISLGISIVGFIAQTGQAYLTNHVHADICVGARDWIERENLIAFAGYPLLVEGRVVGVLALFSRQPLSQMVQETLGWIANSVAVAIDRAWAREELLNRREALLFRLASQIRNSLDLDTILATAVNEIRALLQIDRCHFLWCWPQSDQPSLAVTHESRHPDLPSLLGDCPPQQAAPLAEKILTQTMLRVSDILSEPCADSGTQNILYNLGITAQLLLPLETRSGQLGAVVCSHCSGARPWLDSEVELLQAVVNQLALAIDQAELYAQTRAAAFAAQTQAHQLSEALQNLKQTQSQLIQSEKMSSLGQMVAGIAHEINNPVNFITGNLTHASSYIQDLLELLQLYQQQYPCPTPAVRERAEEIDIEFLADDLPKLLSSMKIGADRIRQIVLSLRNFSRLDEAEMKPVDIHEGIDNTLLILQNRLKATPERPAIEIVKEYGELPRVECYAGQLNQVFMNVLCNAIDALENNREPRQITIATATTHEHNQSGNGKSSHGSPNYIQIRIRDNGPGMSESVRTRLFDPFFTTKPIGKGTGLGLSISYQIVVDRHGGRFECHSQPGQGAEFVIQIPIVPPTRLRMIETPIFESHTDTTV